MREFPLTFLGPMVRVALPEMLQLRFEVVGVRVELRNQFALGYELTEKGQSARAPLPVDHEKGATHGGIGQEEVSESDIGLAVAGILPRRRPEPFFPFLERLEQGEPFLLRHVRPFPWRCGRRLGRRLVRRTGFAHGAGSAVDQVVCRRVVLVLRRHDANRHGFHPWVEPRVQDHHSPGALL